MNPYPLVFILAKGVPEFEIIEICLFSNSYIVYCVKFSFFEGEKGRERGDCAGSLEGSRAEFAGFLSFWKNRCLFYVDLLGSSAPFFVQWSVNVFENTSKYKKHKKGSIRLNDAFLSMV